MTRRALLRVLKAVPVQLRHELKLAVRVLRRRPTYVATTACTLGLGVGGIVAIFAVANWLLLRPVPGVPDARELAAVRLEAVSESPSPAFGMSEPDRLTLVETMPELVELEGEARYDTNVVWDDGAGVRAARVRVSVVSPGWFDLLRIVPSAGALPSLDSSSGHAALVSDRVARRAFGGVGSAVGRTIRINGVPVLVAGIGPRGFRGPELPGDTDIWLPSNVRHAVDRDIEQGLMTRRGDAAWQHFVAQVRGGVEVADVAPASRVAIQAIRDAVAPPHSFAARLELRAWPGLGLSPRVRGEVSRTLQLVAAAGLVLMALGLANVANLSLSSSVSRIPADAVHAALGATRRRMLFRAALEHGLIGTAGGLVGLLVAGIALSAFRIGSLSTVGAPMADVAIDLRVAAFALAVAVGVAILAALMPYCVLAGTDLGRVLRGHRSPDRARLRIQQILVVAQVALSVVLLVGGGLLVRTFTALSAIDPGFEPARAVRFMVDPGADTGDGPEAEGVIAHLLEQLRSDIDIAHAGAVSPLFVDGSFRTTAYVPAGGREDDMVRGAVFHVTDDFLEAAGVRLIAGRLLDQRDVTMAAAPDDSVVAAIVTEAFAAQAVPGAGPPAVVGRQFQHARGGSIRVEGVVADVRHTSLTADPRPVVFLPRDPAATGAVAIWVRSPRSASQVGSRLPAMVAAAVPALPVYDVRGARAQVDALVIDQKMFARMGTTLALLGLALAGTGLYGVLSCLVEARRPEIGIRLALGARALGIATWITRYALGLTTAGIVVGAVGASLAVRYLTTRLYGVGAADPWAWVTSGVVLVVVSVTAALGPVLRSRKVSALDTLRSG
jgi:predicted permease